MEKSNYCIHCDPYPQKSSHLLDRAALIVDSIVGPLNKLGDRVSRSFKSYPDLSKSVISTLFKILFKFKILQELEIEGHEESIYNRTLVVYREAKKRNVIIRAVKVFGRVSNLFTIEARGIKKIFDGLPHLEIGGETIRDFDNKGELKKIFQGTNIPHPQGRVFYKTKTAVEYVENIIDYPVVVKPVSGSLSKHTICNITAADQLKEAISIVRNINKLFVVEKYIAGNVYRILVVGGEVIASCYREPPNVVGDGVHAIDELIEFKNRDHRRGDSNQKNTTLHKIVVSPRSFNVLATQNFSLKSILANGQKAYIHDKVILACGADIHDTTDITHPDNIELFKKISALCGAPVIGIDFIVPDIARPHHRQMCGVIEINSLPYIDMHHYPTTGKARNVASQILDHYFAHAAFSDALNQIN